MIRKKDKDVPGPWAFPIIGTSWLIGGLFGKYTMDALHHMYKGKLFTIDLFIFLFSNKFYILIQILFHLFRFEYFKFEV